MSTVNIEKIQGTKMTKFLPQWNKGQSTARIEAFYGPWSSITAFLDTDQAKEAIKVHDVVTVGVWDGPETDVNSSVREYWNPKGNKNFVLKNEGLATETFVDNRIAELIGGAPETLDTLKEITDAMEAHEGAYTELLANVGLKATKEYVDEQLALKAGKEEIPSVDVFVGAITEDLETKATKDDLESLESSLNEAISNNATKDELSTVVESINSDLETKATKDDLESLESSLNEAISNNATKEELSSAVATLNALVATKSDINHIHEQYLTTHQSLDDVWAQITALKTLPHFTKDEIFGFIKEYIIIALKEYLSTVAPEPEEVPTPIEIPTKPIYWAMTDKIDMANYVGHLNAKDIEVLDIHPIEYYWDEPIEPVTITNVSDNDQVVLLIVPEDIEVVQIVNGENTNFVYARTSVKIGFDNYTIYGLYRIDTKETWHFGNLGDYGIMFNKKQN